MRPLLQAHDGEFVASHFARAFRWSCMSTENHFIAHVRKELSLPAKTSISRMMALATECDPVIYASRHTTMPLEHCVSDQVHLPFGAQGDHEYREMQRNFRATHFFSCPQCVRDHLRSGRIPYLKRDHQYHALSTCFVHQTSLASIPKEHPNALQPDEWIESPDAAYVHREDLNNEAINRYERFVQTRVTNCVPIAQSVIRQTLRHAMTDRGISIYPAQKTRTLSQFASDLLPAGWLHRFFAGKSSSQQSWSWIFDSIAMTRRSHVGQVYGLALAVLVPEQEFSSPAM